MKPALPSIPYTAYLDPKDETSWLRLLAFALDSATNGIVISLNTPELPIVYCNAAFRQLTGYSNEEILGHNCRFLQGEDTDPKARAQMRTAFAAGEPVDLVILNYKKDGTPFWNALNIGPLRHEEGQVTHFIGVQTDVTERVQTQRQLEAQVLTDALTGLPNRAHFMRELERAATDPVAQGKFAVGFIDLDGFKNINDTLGHDAGDALLIQVGQRLKRAVRGMDIVARLAGDEFVMLLPGVESDEALAIVAQRALEVFQSAYALQGGPVLMGASLGFVRHTPDETSTALLARADQLMYNAKRGGKNKVVID
ncbi:diguanylate cyclase [Deinococcus psychrotolerans]|uniref:Diguanylate cyclase n=1 Tax=Deinococcus psychrotolerans TaxID=2489213 RepID=A0A3G8YGV5_9DEIO|nr:diguanylate cyclase [Deinococcus psychrotolerans]AZI44070.1 diguanylate cyclase [Deinococcus psychrotolerans]